MTEMGLRVLIVDEPAVRRLIAMALGKYGVQCDHAENGIDALRQLKSKRYDAVVTELAMSKMNGHALAVEILSMPDRPLVSIVTCVHEPRLALDLLARGVDDLVFKPVDYPGLALKLRILLDRRSALRSKQVSQPVSVDPTLTTPVVAPALTA